MARCRIGVVADAARTDPAAYAARAEATLKALVREHLVDATVVLFGSRSDGTSHRRSDFDVAYLPREGFDPVAPARLREAIEESNVIYRVDLVDLSATEPGFREKVLREGVVWKS